MELLLVKIGSQRFCCPLCLDGSQREAQNDQRQIPSQFVVLCLGQDAAGSPSTEPPAKADRGMLFPAHRPRDWQSLGPRPKGAGSTGLPTLAAKDGAARLPNASAREAAASREPTAFR